MKLEELHVLHVEQCVDCRAMEPWQDGTKRKCPYHLGFADGMYMQQVYVEDGEEKG